RPLLFGAMLALTALDALHAAHQLRQRPPDRALMPHRQRDENEQRGERKSYPSAYRQASDRPIEVAAQARDLKQAVRLPDLVEQRQEERVHVLPADVLVLLELPLARELERVTRLRACRAL